MLRRLSSILVLAWAAVSTAAAQQNDLAFIARPCPSNISSPQVHMVIPIIVGGISIPFIVCASLGNLSLDLTGAVPTLNATVAGPSGTTISCPTPQSCFGMILTANPDGSTAIAVNSVAFATRQYSLNDPDGVCVDTSGTTASVCQTPNPASWGTAYVNGQVVRLLPSANWTGSASLNVNNLGLKSIKQSDGVTDPGVRAVQGRWVILIFNGTVWTIYP